MEPLCTCHSNEFISIDRQPEEFVSALDPERHAAVLAACQSVAMGFSLGRPHGSRTALIANARMPGLFVLRVVWPGMPEPQLRLICVRSGQQILVARGFIQDGPRIPTAEVEMAEAAIGRAGVLDDERRAGKPLR